MTELNKNTFIEHLKTNAPFLEEGVRLIQHQTGAKEVIIVCFYDTVDKNNFMSIHTSDGANVNKSLREALRQVELEKPYATEKFKNDSIHNKN